MSQVVGKRPDLFTAYLQINSQWDGEYEPVVEQRLPVYFAVGRNDEYYGSGPSQAAYDTLHDLYVQQGLSEAEIAELLVLDIKEHEYFTDRECPMSMAEAACLLMTRTSWDGCFFPLEGGSKK